MTRRIAFLLIVPLSLGGVVRAADYAIGADLSFLKQAEDAGTVFKDANEVKPGLQIFKDHGYNWIRLRLFHSPTQLPNDLEYTKTLAAEAKAMGYKFLLNYHYSDTWADLRENLVFTATTYDKDIMLVEVAYNWRPTEYRRRPAPFPETPDGQAQFLDEVQRLLLETPNGRGIGIFWWEPAVTGSLRSRGMFDNDGNALPVINVFDKYTRH